jgi:hypothetical protein
MPSDNNRVKIFDLNSINERGFASALFEVLYTNLKPGTYTFRVKASNEAIYNVIKHANPRNVYIHLSFYSDKLHIRIADDGKGFNCVIVGASVPSNERFSGKFLLVSLRCLDFIDQFQPQIQLIIRLLVHISSTQSEKLEDFFV